jgi:hypothetical protein
MTVSTSEATQRSRPARKKRRYSDGHPLDHVQYVESKIILRGDRFTSVDTFDEFARLVKRTAKEAGVDFSRKAFREAKPRIREVPSSTRMTSGSTTTLSSCAGGPTTSTGSR